MHDLTDTLEIQLLSVRDDSNTVARLDALLDLAEQMIRRDNHRVLELVHEAQALARNLADVASTPQYARILLLAGRVHSCLGEQETAKHNLSIALERFGSLGDHARQARCLNALGIVDEKQGHYARALEQYLTALSLFQASEDKQVEGFCLTNIGNVYSSLGDYATALDYYMQVLQLTETYKQVLGKHKTLELTALISNNISNVFGCLERWSESLEYAEHALQMARQVSDKLAEGVALSNTGQAYLKLQCYEKALSFLEAALMLFQQLGDRRQELNALALLGQVHGMLGQSARALERFETGLELARSHRLLLQETFLRLSLSKHLIESNDTVAAQSMLQLALEFAEHASMPAEQSQAHLLLVRTYKTQANFEQALAHHERFHELYERLHGEKQDKRVEMLIVQHEVEKTRSIAETQRVFNEKLQAANVRLEQSHSQLEQAFEQNQRLLEQVQYQAQHDVLTGLPNRILFADRLEQALSYATRYDEQLAIIYIDLNGFKAVNDQMGHKAGDELLVKVARRLKDCLRKSDTVARMGGDEFVMIIRNVGNINDVQALAEKLLSTISETVELNGREEAQVGASIGISLYPKDGNLGEELQRRADAAMYQVKRTGKSGVRRYDQPNHDAAEIKAKSQS